MKIPPILFIFIVWASIIGVLGIAAALGTMLKRRSKDRDEV